MMPVFNGEAYVREAVSSVLTQTETSLELVVIDDGSSDGTARILGEVDDSRLRVIRSSVNRGIATSRNEGLAVARGRFIAPLDADDIAHPRRLERQLSVFQTHSNCVLVAGGFEEFSDAEGVVRTCNTARSDAEIRWDLLFENRIAHSSAMFRRADAEALGGYPAYYLAEDYAFWSRLLAIGQVWMPAGVVVRLRHHGAQVSGRNAERMAATATCISAENLSRFLHREVPPSIAAFLRGETTGAADEGFRRRAWAVLQDAFDASVAACGSRRDRALLARSLLQRVTTVLQTQRVDLGIGLSVALSRSLRVDPRLAVSLDMGRLAATVVRWPQL